MKKVSLENGHLIVSGHAQGTVTMAFSIICFIIFLLQWGGLIGYIALFLGIFLLFISAGMTIINSKKKYLEIENNLLSIFPTGSNKIRYEIPLSRISYLTHLNKQKSQNTRILAIVLNFNPEPCFWINGPLKEELSKKEIDLEFLPIKDKSLADFFSLLEAQYHLSYKKTSASIW